MSELIATADVALILGVERKTLLKILERHPYLKPTDKVGPSFVWTDEEVDAARKHIERTKLGRPKGGDDELPNE